MSLARSTWDMAKIGEDLFGLLEFYPHIKRRRKKKNGASKEGTTETPEEGIAETRAEENGDRLSIGQK